MFLLNEESQVLLEMKETQEMKNTNLALKKKKKFHAKAGDVKGRT